MKKTTILSVIFCVVLAWTGLAPSIPTSTGVENTINYVTREFGAFSSSAGQLANAANQIDTDNTRSIRLAKEALVNCRLHYKRIEYFLEYFFRSSALIYNNPAKYEVEEPYMEFEAPRGLQVIEALLFEKNMDDEIKTKIKQQADALNESAKDLGNLLYDFTMNDRQLLESFRLELIRIITLGISGYDAPLLKTGIYESYEALQAIQVGLQPYLPVKSNEGDSLRFYFCKALQQLQAKESFDCFDRLDFLTGAALPLQQHLGSFISRQHLELNTVPSLNYKAANIFSKNAFNDGVFSNPPSGTDDRIRELGRKLFFEKSLSGNASRSCATCHQPGKYFSDGLPRSVGYDGHSFVKRNAPSLLYAGLQYSQFWDGRAKTLEAQVKDVMRNPEEMNANATVVLQRLQRDVHYREYFTAAFAGTQNTGITIDQVSIAIASYVRSLMPMDSPFDRYLAGDKKAMSDDQVAGFNLFMGKAQCGTCHFPPMFNGLRPPLYIVTEFEVLGVPWDGDLVNPTRDPDDGRFAVLPVPFYKQAFKTPSLRNVAATAPYMHNGGFKTLEKVMDFYNNGGGNGIGLETPTQTLSSEKLGLSAPEIKQLIDFMRALTDTTLVNTRPTAVE